MHRVLYMLNKPYGILSQHSDEGSKSGWGRLNPPFGSDVYSIGRLDADSEGLLLFTNDNAFKTRNRFGLPEIHQSGNGPASLTVGSNSPWMKGRTVRSAE